MPESSETRSQAEYAADSWSALIRENHRLRAENRRLREEADDPVHSVYEVATHLEGHGFHDARDWTYRILEEWVRGYNDWWKGAFITPEGRKHVRLTRSGFMFTPAGVRAAELQFLGEAVS
ncbi:hypothetical protein L3Y21_gp053 [Gordonia phage Rabbitrun]|uniref:Uncharacterized protein n=1 Tax=Gordonia phage Rabbitrun TaxID=2762280 RepID=A0A7G8LIM4_9CAUD|nr:hypothetical protein L3Y21_gp053 [Gordonia phage Rabbitrun]QNJ57096.1 hypothetical protein SEA_RABBITRUN_53 [Gordonia phage Rabbitrun]